MLRFLRINRLAVIDAVEVEFAPGLNVLTGETGAGKSILVEAVGLLLGGRASGDLVRTGEEVATIEAIFESGGHERLIRREITAQGRSRAYIDGELVTAGALKEIAAHLVELHGQHEHQTLLDPTTHLAVLDAFAAPSPDSGEATDSPRTATAEAFGELQAAEEELGRVRTAVSERASRQELAAFQLAELDRAGLKAGEDTDLAAARQILASAERVERLCLDSYAALYESDGAVLAGLGGVWRRVAELSALDPRFLPFLEARDGIKSELEDLALFLRRYADTLDASPARLQQVEERLAVLERLKRKYGRSLSDVMAKRDALSREMADLEAGDQRIEELMRRQARARERYLSAAQALSVQRRRAALTFATALESALAELAMERTRFDVRFAEPDERMWTADGIDIVEFFVSPNPGEDLRPLARIASGGELSRIMLAIKTLSATSRHGLTEADDRAPSPASAGELWDARYPHRLPGAGAPGLIFDEVDAGIGGRVADVVGRKLRALGSAFQVLCITHLPQIAAYADAHFQIEKRVEAGRTRASVTRLDSTARIDEISRMLGGADVTEGIRASAREMLEQRAGRSWGQAKGESERAKGESRARKPRTQKTR